MNEMTPADYAAITNNNDGFGGGNGAWWIIILFIFALFGWGGRGFGGGTAGSGAADNYVLASDFAQVERKLDTVNAGLCDGFYAQNTGMLNGFSGVNTAVLTTGNAIQSQLAQCCCDQKAAIADVNYNMAINTNTISREVERGFCDTNYNMATQHNSTMQAIDKVGDRVIDWLANNEAQKLRDENQALRLAASQSAQNSYLINQLRPMPVPAYQSCNPWASVYGGGGCNCNGWT